MGLLPLASCTVFQVSGVLAHSVVVFSLLFFFEEEDWLLDIRAVNVTCG